MQYSRDAARLADVIVAEVAESTATAFRFFVVVAVVVLYVLFLQNTHARTHARTEA